jgi:hypothetical protein
MKRCSSDWVSQLHGLFRTLETPGAPLDGIRYRASPVLAQQPMADFLPQVTICSM